MQLTDRVEQGRRTRSLFVDAAAFEFARRDYEATSLADIAAILEKPKAALRYHFATKAQLARAVIETQYETWTDLVRALDASNARGLSALLALLAGAIEESARSPYTQAVIRLLLGDHSEDLRPESFPFSWPGIIRARIDEARDLAELPANADTDAVYQLIVDASFGIYQSPSRNVDLSEPEASFGPLWRLILEGVGVADVASILDGARAVRASLDYSPPVRSLRPGLLAVAPLGDELDAHRSPA
jgi:AcrR family transcriptional regulator